MNLWMSIPSVAFQTNTISRNEEVSSALHVKCSKTEQIENVLVQKSSDLKRILSKYALAALLKGEDIDWIPNVVIGCNVLLDKELVFTDILAYVDWAHLPMNVLDCSDLTQAFSYLPMIEHAQGEEAILLTLHGISERTDRLDNEYVLGNAAAAVGFSCHPDRFAKSFRVLSIAHSQVVGHWDRTVVTIIDSLLSDTESKRQSICWTITQKFSKSFEEVIKKQLPRAILHERELQSETNYGCADILISLDNIFVTQRLPPMGNGIVWYMSEGGTIGAILLDSGSVSLWNRYTSETPRYA